MSDREKLLNLTREAIAKVAHHCANTSCEKCAKDSGKCDKESGKCQCRTMEMFTDHLIANGVTVSTKARPLEEWNEDIGDVLWWKFPIEEPPYVGSPLDCAWTGYHTHWTQIRVPEPPKEDAHDG